MKRINVGFASRTSWILLLCGLSLSPRLFGQAVRTQIEIDSTELLIGNPVQLTLTVDHPGSVEIEFPLYVVGKELGGMEILTVDSLRQSGEGSFVRLEQQLQLTAFDSGYFQIPPQQIRSYPNGDTSQASLSQTNPLLIRYNYPAVDTTQAYKPIKDIRDVPFGFADIWPWLAGIGLALLLIGLPIFLIFYRKAKPTAFRRPPPPPVPPHEIAMKRLADLEAEKRWQKGDFRGYYFELSYIIRAYVEGRFKVMALESTTDAILGDLSGKLQDLKQTERLKELLQMAELAKFAKVEPTMQENMSSLDTARTFVKKTKPVKLAPPTAETAETENADTNAPHE